VVGEGTAVDIGDVRSQDERWALSTTAALEQSGLTDGELYRVRGGLDQGVNCGPEVFDTRQKCGLTEEAMIDRDVKATL
jgi:hypothetical protein